MDTDRVLVLIQLGGGSDGLNVVVPVTNDRYYQLRPTIAVQPANTFALDSDFGLNGVMGSLESMWGEGQMAVVHAVGYPDHNLSHFRSTDIWASASGSDETLNTGWTGRYLDEEYPDYVSNPPEYPVALRIGGATGMLLRGGATTMGMSFSNASQFDQLAATGELYDESDVPDNVFGEELAFVRSVYNASLRYVEAVIDAADAGTNDPNAAYPGGGLGDSLAIVARLIKGGLQSRLYVVHHGGFDTHSNQNGSQPGLLQALAEAASAFQTDLEAGGRDEDVLTMTFSEFGRRVEENGRWAPTTERRRPFSSSVEVLSVDCTATGPISSIWTTTATSSIPRISARSTQPFCNSGLGYRPECPIPYSAATSAHSVL